MSIFKAIFQAVYHCLWGDLFTIPLPGGSTLGISLLVLILIPSGIYFTLRTRFLPFRLFPEMLRITAEKRNKSKEGAISGVQALIVSTATRVGGITLARFDDAVQLCTKESMYEYLVKIAKAPRKLTLTDTVLETLSIIAYKQPVTRVEVERVRGVNCDHAINKLLEYDLITELGRLDAPGRPLLFGTTEQFLRCFGVGRLDELPELNPVQLEEFKQQAEAEVQMQLDV